MSDTNPDDAAAPRDPNAELLWLLGQPSLDEFLHFMKWKAVGGGALSPAGLADEWRAANDLYHDLQTSEAGAADDADCRSLPREMAPLARRLRRHPWYRAAYDALPTQIRMVEVGKLIASQTHIANIFSTDRAHSLGPSPSPDALFDFCLPINRPDPPVRIQRLSTNRYLFSSPSTDLRAQEPILLDPAKFDALKSFGPVAGAIALPVGFGSNFMSAIRSEGRLVLHNGYHRAHTLHSLGITHAPCVVETVTRTDELKLTAGDAVSDDPVLYFRSKRPPMLRDFFDPRLVKRFAVRPMETMVEVEFTLKSWTATDVA